MDKIEHFFNNIIAKTYIEDINKKNLDLNCSEVEEVFWINQQKEKSYLLGKTKEIYFVITYENSGYEYSIIQMHHDPITILKKIVSHKNNIGLLGGENPELFWEKLQLVRKLDKDLKQKETKKKTYKI